MGMYYSVELSNTKVKNENKVIYTLL